MTGRPSEDGVVLVNVLVILAIAGGLVFLLLGNQDAALDRVSRAADAAIAEQIALGAEASVIDALRRDLDNGLDTDHFAEPWAQQVIQSEVELPTGRFSVAVSDVQAKYDINQLADQTLVTRDFATRLFARLDLAPELADRVARVLANTGPVARIDDLAAFGVPAATLDILRPHVTGLPVPGTVNLNTVGPLLLSVMMRNDSLAARVIAQRAAQGTVTRESLLSVGASRPQNSGFTSNVFDVDILAEAGDARLVLKTTLVRRNDRTGKSVAVFARRFIDEPPDPDAD